MNKKLAFIGVPIAVVVVVLMGLWGSYKNLVNLDENVTTAWSKVENQYQRRFDLVPQIVDTIKGSTEHEKEMLAMVTDARTKYNQAQSNNSGDAKSQKELVEATENYSQTIGTVVSVINEDYPEVSSTKQFQDLIVIIEGSENRIATERGRYNDDVAKYNKKVRTNIFAGMFGFERKEPFKATTGAETPTKIDFSK